MGKLIKSIKMGSLCLENNLFLAPMEGFTNVAFRKNLCKYGKLNSFTEMIPAASLSKDSNYCKDLLYRDNVESCVFYQLFGNKPFDFTKSIKNTENLADAYNINLGCPVEKIISQGAGCALLKRKAKIYEIIKELRKVTEKPITIKIRTGYTNPTHLDYNLLESIGCDAVFIHSRTCKQKYSGHIDYNFLREAKEKSNIPIIGNGDICRFADIAKMKEKCGVDGFMIGRSSLHNPLVFKNISDETDYEKWASTMSVKNKIEFLGNYYNDLKEYDIKNPFNKTKTLGLFLFRYINNAKYLRNKLVITKNYDEFYNIISEIR